MRVVGFLFSVWYLCPASLWMCSGELTRAGKPAMHRVSCWFASWKILKCNTITLIGINHGWEETDSLKTIMSHGNVAIPPKISQKSKLFKKLYPKIFNPDFHVNF